MWNIEGFQRNLFSLKHYCTLLSPDFIFLSEPQLFSCDLPQVLKYFSGEYCSSLNSDDCFDPELPLVSRKAHGGTMALWRKNLDPCVKTYPTSTASILPIIFKPPDSATSIHITVYLPTSGQEGEFIDALAQLANTIEDLEEEYPKAMVFIRGDANVNPQNTLRIPLFHNFCQDFRLSALDFHHSSYHHFTGNGLSDSQLDVILLSDATSESILKIFCKHENPLINSHHDIISTCFNLPLSPMSLVDTSKNITAPKIQNDRVKISWSDAGILSYKEVISPYLEDLRNRWSNPSSPEMLSVLLQSTNKILSKAATLTNKSSNLGNKIIQKSQQKPRELRTAESELNKAHQNLKKVRTCISSTTDDLAAAKSSHSEKRTNLRKVVRVLKLDSFNKRDKILDAILSTNPSATHKFLRSLKTNSVSELQKLTVNDKIYSGSSIPDGFFDSLSSLKTHDPSSLLSSPSFRDLHSDYENIIKICSIGPKIPPLSLEQSTDILLNLRPNVNDLYSITASHYVNAGPEGFRHFNYLLNVLISDMNNVSLPEVNSVYAIILYKGHCKEKTSDRSYRTISTCPVLAKSLDTYIRQLNIQKWSSHQADTQFQGQGSSHDLASLLLTEVIQHSLYTSKEPVYALYLDAKSAFDLVLREILIRNLFLCGTSGEELIYINERLKNRQTYCEWDKCLMGPIRDTLGIEQGGVNSDNFYKIHNNEQLSSSQNSNLGVSVGDITISAIGQADDVVLTSNNIYSLFNLLHITLCYCSKFQVSLVPDKTKLQVFLPSSFKSFKDYFTASSPLVIDSQRISFTDTAEHVGVIRSTSGNLPNLMNRVLAVKKALGVLLSAGLAKGHRASPAACLSVNKVHGVPVLMSGLSSQVLNKSEINLVARQHKQTLLKLQKLHTNTPSPVVFFLAGSLPGTAVFHLRQMTIFGMISRLPGSLLHQHAVRMLTVAKPSSMSWFLQIRDICLLYSLPHPLRFLQNPLTKTTFKSLVKSKVIDYWEIELRRKASSLRSLPFFNPEFMSLSRAHPIWVTSKGNPYETNKAIVQARFISGRYRTETLCRFWSNNPDGVCLLRSCLNKQLKEDVIHILVTCASLACVRDRLIAFFTNYGLSHPYLMPAIRGFLGSSETSFKTQFLLDCSVLPEVILLQQHYGLIVLNELFYLTRTWCFTIHRERLRMLDRWTKL